ncbi:MAG: amino acid ABC transporter permease, partial [Pseudomonadota bacterium]|nr:amino acid ABC transporter permease [Pseudomonadota bacterium]
MAKEKQRQSEARGPVAYVRREDAPMLPPPPSQAGLVGWLYKNIFASMSDFGSIGATFRSLLMAGLTVFLLYFLATQLYGLLDFALLSAVWFDPDGVKREACWTVEQGGALPAGWHAACWPYIAAKAKFIFYGAYPEDQLWRVNLAYVVGAVMLVWVMIERLPYRKHVGL